LKNLVHRSREHDLGQTRLCVALSVMLAGLVLVAGCGGDNSTGTDESTTREQTVQLLNAWEMELVPDLLLLRKRAVLFQSGRRAESIVVGARAKNHLRGVLSFGRDARKAFIDTEPTDLTTTVIAAGDAWTKWANTGQEILPGGGTFQQGTQLADLGAEAIRLQRKAYQLAGEPIPPVFRVAGD
jgi:hypothetical protein